MSKLSDQAHIRGVARVLNATYGTIGAPYQMYVQTCLPFRFLALYAARRSQVSLRWNWDCVAMKRTGRFQWRWVLRGEKL